jgi:ribosome-associated toxin RatA of RatAB toxin-antitoxin module
MSATIHLEDHITIAATPAAVYALAAPVERWPSFLPHYRWVTLLSQRGEHERLVEMAARRGWIPVWWRSIQRLYPEQHRIEFLHVAGATRGMTVHWRIEDDGRGGSRVSIAHDFLPPWPLVPHFLAELVVGRFFVSSIAGRTLREIKALAEDRSTEPAAVRASP